MSLWSLESLTYTPLIVSAPHVKRTPAETNLELSEHKAVLSSGCGVYKYLCCMSVRMSVCICVILITVHHQCTNIIRNPLSNEQTLHIPSLPPAICHLPTHPATNPSIRCQSPSFLFPPQLRIPLLTPPPPKPSRLIRLCKFKGTESACNTNFKGADFGPVNKTSTERNVWSFLDLWYALREPSSLTACCQRWGRCIGTRITT